MKKIQKKWMLFLLTTFITVFGIGYTLLKNTFAVDNNLPENSLNFDEKVDGDIYE